MKILYPDTVVKRLRKINAKDLKKIQRKLKELELDPLLGKPLTGELQNERSLRAWPLRIIYIFDSENQIIYIVDIDYRGNVYK